jgi:hypothetical protein
MRLHRFERLSSGRWVGLLLFAAAIPFGGCGEEDSHPPPAPTGPFCEQWTCVEEPNPVAAIAVEYGSPADGGACDAWRFSVPAGDDAFTSIRSCGGNQIRCGAADYRIGATEPGTTLTCVVAPSSRVHVGAHLSQANGAHFDVDGDIDASGGTVTISAGAAPDGGTVEVGPTTCRVTDVQFLVLGSVWASFDCAPDGDAAACAARGTFVFESCSREVDAG